MENLRTRKFRGISTDTGNMVYGHGFCYFEGRANIIHKQGINLMQHTDVIPETVGDFCGLHDKNGKEIYEGDLVQHDAWNYPFQIIFNNEKARFVSKMKTGLTQYIDFERLAVIGNIYENPELLATPIVAASSRSEI